MTELIKSMFPDYLISETFFHHGAEINVTVFEEGRSVTSVRRADGCVLVLLGSGIALRREYNPPLSESDVDDIKHFITSECPEQSINVIEGLLNTYRENYSTEK